MKKHYSEVERREGRGERERESRHTKIFLMNLKNQNANVLQEILKALIGSFNVPNGTKLSLFNWLPCYSQVLILWGRSIYQQFRISCSV